MSADAWPDELKDLEALIEAAGSLVSAECLGKAGAAGLPVYAISLGNPSPEAGAVAFIGGVHGLERIGAQVVTAYLRSVISRLRWDQMLQQQLEHLRLVFLPVLNPTGLQRRTRANHRGVDLMRNAPVEAAERVPFLVGGQRWSTQLPWYRGRNGDAMEIESQALCRLIERELLPHRFSLSVDCHSGFGTADRLWFPYAHTRQPIDHLPEMHALTCLLDDAHHHHRYVIEPQSRQYLAHGDLWDYLYLRARAAADTVFLPLTLEMGSWLWVKKNPRQLFSRQGIFNPLLEHREQRVLRRHLFCFDFLTRAAASFPLWLPAGAEREHHRRQALARWYADGEG